ncbi:MAG: OmpA family protein [Bacteroidota bacterium]
MMQRLLLLILTSLPMAAVLQAQPLAGSTNFEQLIAIANLEASQNNYSQALAKYEEAFEKREEDSLVARIAYLNYQLRDYAGAQRGYRRLFRRREAADTTFNDQRLYYGMALKSQGEYDDAIMVRQDYLRHETDPEMRSRAQLEITGAELGQNLPENTSEVEVEIMNRRVLGTFSEYSPALSEDGSTLYFSTWKTSDPANLQAMDDEVNVSRIFKSVKNEDGEWQRPEPLGVEVNRPEVHTANPAISADGRRLYFNRLILQGNEPIDARIYVSDVDDAGWKSGSEVDGLGGGEYLALQPNVGELFGDEVLFFVSDMTGGFGGYDIYYAPYNGDGSYGTPINLGETVNTAGDDVSPFFFDGTLYFSTDGLPTMGGRDIYYTVWNGAEWSQPEHMGAGFNSPADDQSFKLYGEGYVGFLTSNREGGRSIKSRTCCDDIYTFEIARLYADLVVGLFTEDREGLVGGSVQLEPMVNNEIVPGGDTQNKEQGNRYDFGLELEYDYMVIGDHPDYYPDTFFFNTKGLEESATTTHRFYLRAKPKPPPEPEFDTIYIEQAYVLENILFDFNKSDIKPEAEVDLELLKGLMAEYPEMVIELSSHTDPQGQDSYNQRLSERRANSTRRWLIQNGVDNNRMTAVGYGETVPKVVTARIANRFDYLNEGDILTEDFINALADEEQKEQAYYLNRRTEVKILEGPTSITVRRIRNLETGEEVEEAPDRNANPGTGMIDDDAEREIEARDADIRQASFPPELHPQSSLYGRDENLEELPLLIFNQRMIELGDVTKGDSREMVFTFRNEGKVPAKIMLIQACECTTVDHDNTRVYQPQEGGEIRAIFDSTEKNESETISIDIFLEQTDSRGAPVMEELRYSYELKQ